MDGTPFTIRSSLTYELTKYRQAGLLALGSAGGGQPSHRGFCNSPAVAGKCLTFSVPDYSGGTAPDSHRVPDCLGFG